MAAKLFRRAALREFTQTAIAVFVALFAIMVTQQLIKLLGQTAGGKVASEAVIALLGFAALNYLPFVLSLTVFISVLMTLSRSYKDSEMVVWFSAGLPLNAWVVPVLTFALPIVLAVGALSLFLSPWALSKSNEYRARMEQREDMSRVTPGAFNESANGERVFYVQAASGDQRASNVFVSSIQHGRLGVMAAQQGHEETALNGDRFLVVEHGRRYEGMPGTPEYRVMEFERYAVRIETREAQGIEVKAKHLPLIELIDKPTNNNMAELLYRIAMPMIALNLALLAIPLSFVNPRAGRANNMIFALLTFMIYLSLINICQAWVGQGKLRFDIGVWAMHGAMLALFMFMMWQRQRLFSWRRLWR